MTTEIPTTRITTTGRWLALAAALLGWLFDGAEMGLFSMVGSTALENLLINDGATPVEAKSQTSVYFGLITAVFLVGAATGGVVFGWLGDRLGRVRAMSLSVLTFAIFTGLCAFAGSSATVNQWIAGPVQLAIFRFIASLGLGGEWALGVALVMEVWPNRSRGLMAGLIGAAANVGYLLVGAIGLVLNNLLVSIGNGLQTIGISAASAEHLTSYQGWRIMMLIGTLPALLTFLFRLFVPESEKWEHERGLGTTSHWRTHDLIGVMIGAAGALLIVFVWSPQFAKLDLSSAWLVRVMATLVGLSIATVGYLYPVIRFLNRSHDAEEAKPQAARVPSASTKSVIRRMLLAAVLSGVALLGTWGSTQWVPSWSKQMVSEKRIEPGWEEASVHAKEYGQMSIALGAVVGTLLAAMCGDWLGRRRTYFMFCILGLISVLWLFLGNRTFGTSLLLSSFVAGILTASFYGWLPLYLPELFSTKLRATGQGFAFNFGRIIAAIGALQAGMLTQAPSLNLLGITIPSGYPLACSSISMIYFVGMVVIWMMPETKGKPLPD